MTDDQTSQIDTASEEYTLLALLVAAALSDGEESVEERVEIEALLFRTPTLAALTERVSRAAALDVLATIEIV